MFDIFQKLKTHKTKNKEELDFDKLDSSIEESLSSGSFEGKVFLSLDIGTTVVKALVFTVKNNFIHTLGIGRAIQQVGAMQGAMISNLQYVIENCDLAVGEAVSKLDKSYYPTDVILGISGELVQGDLVVANYDRSNPSQPITLTEITNSVNTIKEKVFDAARDEIAGNIGIEPSQLTSVSTFVSEQYIDDTKLDSLIGRTGQQVSFKLYIGYAPKIHIEALNSIVEYLGLNLSKIVVVPYAIARSFESAKDNNFSAIFVDIGGGTTDVAIIDYTSILGTKMFAMGGRSLTKRIEQILQIPYEQAEFKKIEYSRLTQYKNQIDRKNSLEKFKLTREEEIKIRTSLREDVRVWATGVEMALSDFVDAESFPATFLLSGGGSYLPEIREALLSYPWRTVLPFVNYPEVKIISPKQISNIIDAENFLSGAEDVSVAAIARMLIET